MDLVIQEFELIFITVF